jgi:hypothetical protein
MFKLQHTLLYHPARNSALFPNLRKQPAPKTKKKKKKKKKLWDDEMQQTRRRKKKMYPRCCRRQTTTQTKEGKLGSDQNKYQNKNTTANTQGGKEKTYNQRK